MLGKAGVGEGRVMIGAGAGAGTEDEEEDALVSGFLAGLFGGDCLRAGSSALPGVSSSRLLFLFFDNQGLVSVILTLSSAGCIRSSMPISSSRSISPFSIFAVIVAEG